MRHAKSSWENFNLSDHERGLNERGKADAPIMAKQLKSKGILPQAIYSSDSERTKQTLNGITKELLLENIYLTRKLYLASEHEIYDVIRNADNQYNCILILAHNPGITDAFKLLANVSIDDVPTSGIGSITFSAKTFSDIKPGTGNLDYFIYPKMY